MLPKCIVFNGVAVFKTPACANDDRIVQFSEILHIVSAARSLTCRDDLDSKWRLLLAENELSCVSLLSSISIGN